MHDVYVYTCVSKHQWIIEKKHGFPKSDGAVVNVSFKYEKLGMFCYY